MRRSNVGPILGLVATVIAGFSYILFGVLGWGIGAQRFPVTAVLARAGGIYPEADVTYRGVAVGEVVGLKLSPGHVEVELAIDPGTKIPVDSTAAVKELTGIGEQYLDLVPRASHGPFLHAGSVIAEPNTSVPTSINTLLIDFGKLLGSVKTSDIVTLNAGLSSGLGGLGPQLRALVTEGSNLVSALRASQAETVELQIGGHLVLSTALTTSSEFSKFSASLAALTGQLKSSNLDLRALLANGDAFENEFSKLLSSDTPSLEALIDNSATVLSTAAARNPAIRALFQALPVFAGDLASVSAGGEIRSELTYNTADPVCPYVSGSAMAAPTAQTGAPNLSLPCLLSAPDLLQRGVSAVPGGSNG